MVDLVLDIIMIKPISYNDLLMKSGLSEKKLKVCLEELEKEYLVFYLEEKYYYKVDAKIYRGICKLTAKGAFIVSDDFKVDHYCTKDQISKVYQNDEVLFKILYNGRIRILKVIKRFTNYFVGEILFYREHTVLKSDSIRDLILIKSGKCPYKVGDIARVYVNKYENLSGVVVSVLGTKDTLGIDVLEILYNNNIPIDFSKESLNEAKALTTLATDYKNRVDYTDKLIYTIDGSDAKDLDDAVSVELLDNGNYLVGVYIADVSHYVAEDSFLDKEALNRGCSVYLPDRVIPMLPVELSNDLCSLNPGQEKLVMAFHCEIDRNGDVVDCSINEGIIKTKKRLTYEDCNKVLKDEFVDEGYQEAYDTLKMLEKVANLLHIKRLKRGAIDFNVCESQIILNNKLECIDVRKKTRGKSERIIEDLMICANESVALLIKERDLPFIYRVHERIDMDNFRLLVATARMYGYNIKKPTPREVQQLVISLENYHEFLKKEILRFLPKAYYSNETTYHFGLASVNYTHFTSPIRRYPDLLVHRLLKRYLIKNDVSDLEKLDSKISSICVKTSEKEKVVDEVTFEVLDMKKAEFMTLKTGEVYNGIVTNVLKRGIYVELPNTVSGFITHVDLLREGFRYKDRYYKHSYLKKSIKMGFKIEIYVKESDIRKRLITFGLKGALYGDSNCKK